MIEEHEFEDDSGDPEVAFVRLEAKFRNKLKENLAQMGERDNSSYLHYIEYMNHTLAAADALQLDIFPLDKVPSHSEQNSDIWNRYQDFTTAVDHYAVKIKIAHVQGRRAFSVALSSAEKEKLRHYVGQIKTVIEESTLSTEKKEALYAKINGFLTEVDKTRTTMKAFSDFVMSAAGTTGDVVDELEPAWKWVRAIALLFGIKIEDAQKRMPYGEHRQQIDGPQRRLPSPKKSNQQDIRKPYDLDDDIPF